MINVADNGAVYSELAAAGILRIWGEEADSFLHSQLTSDVKAMGPGQSQYTSWCSPKGRVLGNGVLWRKQSTEFLWFFPAELLPAIHRRLQMFVLRAKVQIEDASRAFRVIGVGGSAAMPVMNSLFDEFPDGVEDAGALKLPGDRHLVVFRAEQTAPWLAKITGLATLAPLSLWHWLSISCGDPWLATATQDLFVPQMLNIDLLGGLSFSKGCYPGQEIVARMRYLGKLKERLYRAHITGNELPEAGAKLYSPAFGDQACGTIINAAPAPDGGIDLLAVIQTSAAQTTHLRDLAGPEIKLMSLPYGVPGTS